MPRPLRVLVVDDHRDCADSTAEFLRLLGHAVRVAHTGGAALAAARADSPDAVVLDLGLPDIDGYTVAETLFTGLPRRPVVVVLTGFTGFEDRTRAAGLDHHLLKPARPDDLARLLDAVPRPA
jgi:CheY-like chemotaxis protein